MNQERLNEETKKLTAKEIKKELETLNKINLLFDELPYHARQRAFDWIKSRFYLVAKN